MKKIFTFLAALCFCIAAMNTTKAAGISILPCDPPTNLNVVYASDCSSANLTWSAPTGSGGGTSGTLATDTWDNSSAAVTGISFDMIAGSQDVTITKIEFPIAGTGAREIYSYYRIGTACGNMKSPDGWIEMNTDGIINVTVVNSAPATTSMPLPTPITIPAGQTYGFYFTVITAGATTGIRYNNPGSGSVCGNTATASNSDLTIMGGGGLQYMTAPFVSTNGSVPWIERHFSGVVHYTIGEGGGGSSEYNVYRDGNILNTTPITTTTYIDNSFPSFTGHTWEVKTICDAGEESDAATKTLEACETGSNDCTPPTNLNVVYASDCGSANLTWTAPTGIGTPSSVTTPAAATTGSGALYFDIIAGPKDITITGFDAPFTTAGQATLYAYYRTGTACGHAQNPDGWTLIGEQQFTITSTGNTSSTHIEMPAPITIPAGETYGFHLGTLGGSGSPGQFRYRDPSTTNCGSTIAASNSNITIMGGQSVLTPTEPFGEGTLRTERVFAGTFYYIVSSSEYNVYRDGNILNTTPVTATTYTDNSFSSLTGHTWEVKTICDAGEESDASAKTLGICETVCDPPTDLKVVYASDCSSANLSWTAPNGIGSGTPESVTSTLTANTGNGALYFDIIAGPEDIIITGFDAPFANAGQATLYAYYRTGTACGHAQNPNGWTLIGEQQFTITTTGSLNLTHVDLPAPITIPAGETYGFHFGTLGGTGTPGHFRYRNPSTTTCGETVAASNSNITIMGGQSVMNPATPFETGTLYTERMFAGTFYYIVSGAENFSYNIYRDGEKINTTLITTQSFTDNTFDPVEGHTWEVKTICDDGEESDAATKTLDACSTAVSCPPPTYFDVVYASDCSSAELTWSVTSNRSIATDSWSGTGTASTGISFDMIAGPQNVVISEIELPISGTGPREIHSYYRIGTACGYMISPVGWIQMNSNGIIEVTVENPAPATTTVPLPNPITIPAGQTYGFYFTVINSDGSTGIKYNSSPNSGICGGTTTASNSDLTITGGGGLQAMHAPFESGNPSVPWIERNFSGVVHYTVGSGGSNEFNVYRDGTKLNTTPVTVTAYTDDSFDASIGHTWEVKAICDAGEESEAATKTLEACSIAPINLDVVYDSECSSALLTWTAPTSGISNEFNIYRDGTKLNTTPVATTTYTDYTFDLSTGHTWEVKAILDNGEESDPTTKTLEACGTAITCYPPIGLDVLYASDCSSADLNWSSDRLMATAPWGGTGTAVSGISFDMLARSEDVTITEIEFPIAGTGEREIYAYYRIGTACGNMTSPEGWIPVNGNGIINVIVENSAPATTPVRLNNPVTIPAEQTYGFYFTVITDGATTGIRYNPSPNSSTMCGSTVTVSNDDLTILGGGGLQSMVAPFVTINSNVPWIERHFSGVVHYTVGDGGSSSEFNVYRDGMKLNTTPVTETTYTDNSFSSNTGHTWEVKTICDNGEESDAATKIMEPCFIPVTNITNVPTSAIVSVPLTLTGIVVPSNATNQIIVWSVSDAENTGATITGVNIFTATGAGTATIMATIEDGLAPGEPYIDYFTIIVTGSNDTFTVNFGTVNAFGTLTTTADGVPITSGASVNGGAKVDFTATPDPNYEVIEWKHNGTVVEGNTSTQYTIESLNSDANVTVEFILIDGINEPNVSNFKIYPNPGNDIVKVVRSTSENGQINIYNNLGAWIKTFEISGTESEINVSSLSAGVYIIKLTTNQEISHQKFIKN